MGCPLALVKERNGDSASRYELALRPSRLCRWMTNHCYYHRLVGLSMLYCHWSKSGELLAEPYLARGRRLASHEVHHIRHWSRCSLHDLAVVPKLLHRRLTSGVVKRLPRPPGGVRIAVPKNPY